MMPAGTHARRASSSHDPRTKARFPEYSQDESTGASAIDESRMSDSPEPLAELGGRLQLGDRWQPLRDQSVDGAGWSDRRTPVGGRRHDRQKSLSEAIVTVRARAGSVSQNAVEIADALAPPVSPRLVLLCLLWFACSILSNASSKAILTALPKPVTLTIVQFLFVCGWCIVSSLLARIYKPIRNAVPVLRNGIRSPQREIIVATLPLTAFQIGGHILNSDAMSRIPVSLVHTIKGLSPLFTVMAYRLFFGIHYSFATYASLIPLTLGVILACSASLRVEFVGLVYAFGSTVLFVTQNIISKKLFTEARQTELDGTPFQFRKPDKLNLLCYSSGLALLFTFPLWLWSEGFGLMADLLSDATVELSGRPGSLDHGRLAVEFVFNGTFHFIQSLVAFVLLGMVSPVTYSVASLIKRVFVIVFAILWFGNPMSNVQAGGIGLTIVGLYLYDRTSDADKADRKLRAKEAAAVPLLPTANGERKKSDGWPATGVNGDVHKAPLANGAANGRPGTKQEETWTRADLDRGPPLDVR